MFKKVVISILFAATLFLIYYFMNSTVSNDGRASNGGRFENNIYTNSSAGMSADLSDRWVYFDYSRVKDSPGDAAEFFTESDEESALFVARRPGIIMEFFRSDSTFSRSSLSLESIYDIAQIAIDNYSESGMRCKYSDHGKISTDTDAEMYYYQLAFSNFEGSGELISVFFNTPECGILVFGTADDASGITAIKDFLKHKVNVSMQQPQAA